MITRLLLLTALGMLFASVLSACAPGSPNPLSSSGDGRVYDPLKRNYVRPEPDAR